MLLRRTPLTVVGLAVCLLGSRAHASVDPAAICKDKKLTAAARHTRSLSRAFGRNLKIPNSAKLAIDVSKASSRLTKDFLAAESAASCLTMGDAAAIDAKSDALVADVLDELSPPDCPDFFVFTTGAPGGTCGRINDDSAGTGTDLTPYGAASASLECGALYCGGGVSATPGGQIPDGATTVFNVGDCSVSTAYVLAAATSTDTGSNLNCTAPACKFGPPLPMPNTAVTATSTCVVSAIAASPAANGTLNAITGAGTLTLPLTVSVQVTGDMEAAPGLQPCPTCTGGTCNSGSNSGGTCATTTSLLTSHDCPASNTPLPPFAVDLSPLTTGTSTMSAAQRTAGCFGTGDGTCKYIEENGVPAGNLTVGPALASTLASTFCIAKTDSALLNTTVDLPGPGAISLKGSADLVP
jgi:hypothetical protein